MPKISTKHEVGQDIENKVKRSFGEGGKILKTSSQYGNNSKVTSYSEAKKITSVNVKCLQKSTKKSVHLQY